MTDRVVLLFGHGVSETVDVTRVSDDVFRLEVTPLSRLGRHWKGDTIRARRCDGGLQFRGVVERSPMRHLQTILPCEFAESAALREFLADVEARGGCWERIFRGVLIVHIPPDCPLDVDAELKLRIQSTAGR